MAQKIGVDKVACRCVIRSTHGLPCAHEIAELMMEGRPIPLSFVHPYWTKLDLVNTVDVSSVLTIDPELESLYNIFQSEPEGGKIVLKQKLRELIDPATTSLIPPSVKVRTKVKTLNEGKLYRTSVKQRLLGYDASFPSKIRHFIHNIVNVESDGHYGFRAIAALLGISEHNWRDIRMNLIGELHTFRDEYIELYGTAMRCLTYLPLRSAAPSVIQHRIITIGFVDDCHFVQVFLKSGSPIPPVARNWHKYRYDIAQMYETWTLQYYQKDAESLECDSPQDMSLSIHQQIQAHYLKSSAG
ncbi:uncharacterized protein LOC127787527 [Diospyros lotus]|uniref:uncharacterized protein LOC127787527 n=1 Tax=Diospyros lotus TaxID=55363 RepID=UPI00224D7526|nr:uncharacterized protein LOC127787527 [Diospyros lotus]